MSTVQGSAAGQGSGPVAWRTRALPSAMLLSRFRLSREMMQETALCVPFKNFERSRATRFQMRGQRERGQRDELLE